MRSLALLPLLFAVVCVAALYLWGEVMPPVLEVVLAVGAVSGVAVSSALLLPAWCDDAVSGGAVASSSAPERYLQVPPYPEAKPEHRVVASGMADLDPPFREGADLDPMLPRRGECVYLGGGHYMAQPDVVRHAMGIPLPDEKDPRQPHGVPNQEGCGWCGDCGDWSTLWGCSGLCRTCARDHYS